MDDVHEEVLPYSTIDLTVGVRDAALTVMCYDVRVHIQATKEDLLGAQDEKNGIHSQFMRFLGSIDEEPDIMQTFEDWLLRPCLPYLQHLPTHKDRTAEISLQDYHDAPTLGFTLKNVGDKIEAVQLHKESFGEHDFKPKAPATDPVVLSALSQGIRCIPASQLVVIRDSELPDWDYYGAPTAVREVNTQFPRYYFKAALERGSFVRELDMLLRARRLDRDVHVSRLAGLVQWSGDASIAGMLLEEIKDAKTLDWAMDDATEDDRLKWMTELRESLEQLHAADIVWGDVKPQNVLIDLEGHAWVVDFGGGYSPTWVSEDMQDTKAGDARGLGAIAEYLGLDVRAEAW